MSRLPDFIVIGAMKSATTTLYHQLRCQSGVFMPEIKEPNFFSDDEIWARGVDWYKGLFAAASDSDICGEASTHYTKFPTHPQTIQRMKSVLPDPRFVYVLRNPIDRLISQYIHQWSEREISCAIDEAVVRHDELINYSRYAYQLRGYIDAFGRDALLIVCFEQFKSEPLQVLSKVCDFIGCRETPIEFDEILRENASSQRVRRIPFDDMLIHSNLATSLRQRLVPKSVRSRIRKTLTMRNRPRLSKQRFADVSAKLLHDLRNLASYVDCELSADCNDANAAYEQIRTKLSH